MIPVLALNNVVLITGGLHVFMAHYYSTFQFQSGLLSYYMTVLFLYVIGSSLWLTGDGRASICYDNSH